MPRLTDLMDLRVQIGTGTGATARYDAARYGQDVYENPDDPWVDVTCDGLEARTWRGGDLQPGIIWRGMAGSLVLNLHDTDSTYDPTNPDSPYAGTPTSRLRPYLPVRLLTGSEPVALAFVDTFDPQRHGTWASVTASDHVTGLADVEVEELERPAETWIARLRGLLAQGFGPRMPADGLGTGPGAALSASRISDDLWAAMQDLSETEQGMVWVDRGGTLRSLTRAQVTAAPVPRFTIGCPHTPGGADIVIQDLDPANPAPLVANHVIASRAGLDGQTDSTVTMADDSSAARYGRRTLRTTVPLPDDTALTAWASNIMGRLAWPTDWPRTAVVEVTEGTAGQPWAAETVTAALTLDLGDTVILDDTHRGRSWVLLVAGVAHTLTPTRMETSIRFLPHPGALAGRYDQARYNEAAYGWSA